MKNQLAEIETIANNPAAPTFANTSKRWNDQVPADSCDQGVLKHDHREHLSDTLQKIKADEAPKLAAHSDSIYLNQSYSRA